MECHFVNIDELMNECMNKTENTYDHALLHTEKSLIFLSHVMTRPYIIKAKAIFCHQQFGLIMLDLFSIPYLFTFISLYFCLF